MRSATNNRFLGVWDYNPRIFGSDRCKISNGVWTLAEVAASQTKGATAENNDGTYFWPVRPGHEANGPTQTDEEGECTPRKESVDQIIPLFCDLNLSFCANTFEAGGGCPDNYWARRSSLQWEYSANDGLTWFRFPYTSLNLASPRLTIGSSIDYTDTADTIYSASSNDASIQETTAETQKLTQFYGVIDSMRISRGQARYVNQICQPYDPRSPEHELIDDFVIFALNIGHDRLRRPGGKNIRYFVKKRGWLVPGEQVYDTGPVVLAPDIRQVRVASGSSSDAIIDTDREITLPTFPPRTSSDLESVPTNLFAYGQDKKITLTWREPKFADPEVITGYRLVFKPIFGFFGTVSGISGNTATITGMSSTAGLISGMPLVKTGGVGVLGGTPIIDSVDSATQITVSSADNNFTAGLITVEPSVVIDATLKPPYTLAAPDISDLANGTQYEIKIATITDVTEYAFSAAVRCTPQADAINFLESHNCLTYSNRDDGYLGRCGIQFPMFVGGPKVSQFLLVDDYILPRDRNHLRDVLVRYATNKNEPADFLGRIWGKKRTIDGTVANAGHIVLVKDQINPATNGVYQVQNDDSEGEAQPWQRVTYNDDIDDLYQTSIVVLRGNDNVGTIWKSNTPQDIQFGDAPVTFEQDQLIGVYKDDFCIEAYFKVYGFTHPDLRTSGANMTLLDTYYRCADKDSGASSGFSGLRIYFIADKTQLERELKTNNDNQNKTGTDADNLAEDTAAVLRGKQGFIVVDIGYHDQNQIVTTLETTTSSGPALRSKLIDANKFYHVAVTRDKDVFRLYVDGVLQDQFLSQSKQFAPVNLTSEQSYLRYRVRPYFYINDYSATKSIQIIVRKSEFYHTSTDLTFEYARRFNGAEGMIQSPDERLLNMPLDFNGNFDPDGVATWPGKPIPDYPADVHVYIVNDYISDGRSLKYYVKPKIRFPLETLTADLATVSSAAADIKYVNWLGDEVTLPHYGALSLNGLTANGTYAQGNIAFYLRAADVTDSFTFTIPKTTVFTAAGGIQFSPRFNTTAVRKSVNELQPGEIQILPSTAVDEFVAVVFVVAKTVGSAGNVNNATVFTTASNFGLPSGALIRLAGVNGAFYGGTNATTTPLTIDGVRVQENMRILVKNQTDETQNGLYIAKTGAWLRAPEMNATAEIKKNPRVFVYGGYKNANKAYSLKNKSSTSNIPIADADIAIDVTPITFEAEDESSLQDKFQVVRQQSVVVGKSLNNDMTVVTDRPVFAVYCVTTENVTLSGPLPVEKADNVVIDSTDPPGFVPYNRPVLVMHQTDKRENGVYVTQTGAWRRHSSLVLSSQFVQNLLISPARGDSSFNADGFSDTFAFEMILGTEANPIAPSLFRVGVDPISFNPAKIELTQLHLPFVWRNVESDTTIIPVDPTTKLPSVQSGFEIEWDDYLPDSTGSSNTVSNDKVVWRLLYRCGVTDGRSRYIVLRLASKIGIVNISNTFGET